MSTILNIDGEDYNQYFSQTLDSTEYIFHIYYNPRNEGWYLEIYDADEYDSTSSDNTDAILLASRRLMPLGNVLKETYVDDLPSGALVCVSTDGTAFDELEPVTDGNFGYGNDYNLLYFTEDEVTEITEYFEELDEED